MSLPKNQVLRRCWAFAILFASLASCSMPNPPTAAAVYERPSLPAPAGAPPPTGTATPALSVPANDALRARVEGAIEPILRKHLHAGVSVAVTWRTATVALASGYADLENSSPAEVDTIYPIGSVTKQFTAAAVLQLATKGLLELDAPISRYFPGVPGAWGVVRLKHLLNHTSGILGYTKPSAGWEAIRPLEVAPTKLLELVAAEPLAFEPGTRFLYSNTGYLLLGLIIEAVTREPYDNYLRRFVLQRARLEQTFPCPNRRVVPRRAHGYAVEGGVLVRARLFSMSNAFAAGDLCSTAGDLIRWQRALWSGQVLDPSALHSMTRVDIFPDATSSRYGFGIAVETHQGHPVFLHGGSVYGYASQVSHYPKDDLTIAVLTNTQNRLALDIELAVTAALLGLHREAFGVGLGFGAAAP